MNNQKLSTAQDGAFSYNLLYKVRELLLQGEDVKRSIELLVRRIIKAAYRISYSGRRWWVHAGIAISVASPFQCGAGYGLK